MPQSYEDYCNEIERNLEKYPKCECCKNPIVDDYGYEVGSGLYCWDCAIDWLREQRVDIDGLIGEGW